MAHVYGAGPGVARVVKRGAITQAAVRPVHILHRRLAIDIGKVWAHRAGADIIGEAVVAMPCHLAATAVGMDVVEVHRVVNVGRADYQRGYAVTLSEFITERVGTGGN